MKWLRACIWPAGGSLKTPDLGYTYAVLVTFNFPNLLNISFLRIYINILRWKFHVAMPFSLHILKRPRSTLYRDIAFIQ